MIKTRRLELAAISSIPTANVDCHFIASSQTLLSLMYAALKSLMLVAVAEERARFRTIFSFTIAPCDPIVCHATLSVCRWIMKSS